MGPPAVVNPGRDADAAVALGRLDDVVGFHLAQAGATTTEVYERRIGAPMGLRKMEYSILMLLEANAALSPKRLLQVLALTPPNLTLLLDRLQQRGLLKRERNEADRRSQNVALTDAGRDLVQRAAAASTPMEQEVSAHLTAAERAMLIELLRKVGGR